MSHPFDVANLVAPALDGIVRALSDRGQTEAERLAKSEAAMRLILAFRPRDAIEVTLSGQAILFNELLADGVRDVLGGMTDTRKQRSLAILVSMGWLAQGYIDRLERRGIGPYPTAVAAAKETAGETADDKGAGGGMPTGALAVETSWLDEPYEQWLVETPADLTAEASAADRVHHGADGRLALVGRDPEPALPRQPVGYFPARSPEAAAAD